jgi:hypothetical protein
MNGEQQPPKFYFLGGRRTSETITESGYSFFVSATLLLWAGLVIIIALARLEVSVYFNKDNMSAITGAASALAAVALAILAILNDLNKGELYLKLALGTATFFFVFSALLSILALVLFPPLAEFQPQVTIYLVAVFAVVFAGFLVGKRFRWRLYVLTPLSVPPLLFVTVSEARLQTTAMLSLVGGTIALCVLSFLFIGSIFAARHEKDKQDDFLQVAAERWKQDIDAFRLVQEAKSRVLAILRDERSRQLKKPLPEAARQRVESSPWLFTRQALENRLHGRKLFESPDVLDNAFRELQKEPALAFYNGDRLFYVAPRPDEIKLAESFVAEFALLVLEPEGKDGNCFDHLVQAICEKVQYPFDVVERYMLPAVQTLLREGYDDYPDDSETTSPFISRLRLIYVRPGEESIKRVSEWLRANIPDVDTRENLSADEIFKLGGLISKARPFPPNAVPFATGSDSKSVELRKFLAGLKN